MVVSTSPAPFHQMKAKKGQIFFLFFPLYGYFVWAFLAFFCLFVLFWPLGLFLLVKHSLDVRITSKVEESTILHCKKFPPWIFFSPQTEVILGRSLPPEGRLYIPSEARCQIEIEGGKDHPRMTSVCGGKKNFQGSILLPCMMVLSSTIAVISTSSSLKLRMAQV